jgi:topoisomerase-4 subunit B
LPATGQVGSARIPADIEVLSGLEPVRRRPGMYTAYPAALTTWRMKSSTTASMRRVGGHCTADRCDLFKDGSLGVIDNGRGMPVDIHPQEKVSGVELILTRLHAGGKFSDKAAYKFSGGLHGVGVSVVNALSKSPGLHHPPRRQGIPDLVQGRQAGLQARRGGHRRTAQHRHHRALLAGSEKFFDSDKFSVPQLRHMLKAKAVLCAGLRITFSNEVTGEKDEWFYTGDLGEYLMEELGSTERLPAEPITWAAMAEPDAVGWALLWSSNIRRLAESYVNLIPTAEGGTHVNGLRRGWRGGARVLRVPQPRAARHQAHPEDVWDKCCYVLSVKIREPQFAGQMKERWPRVMPRRGRGLCPRCHGAVAERHADAGEKIASSRSPMPRSGARGTARGAQARVRRSGAAGQARRLRQPGAGRSELFLVEGDSAGGSASRRANGIPGHHAAARQDPEHLGAGVRRDCQSEEVHNISVALGVDPGSADLSSCAITRSASSRTPTRTDSTSPPCCARCSCGTSGRWSPAGTSTSPCRRCTASMRASRCYYALDDAERDAVIARIAKPRITHQAGGDALQGPG